MNPEDLRRLADRVDNEPPWQGEQVAVVRALRDLADRIDVVFVLHVQCDERAVCQHDRPTCISCDCLWPCPTVRALTRPHRPMRDRAEP